MWAMARMMELITSSEEEGIYASRDEDGFFVETP